jgi:hypothetical protein
MDRERRIVDKVTLVAITDRFGCALVGNSRERPEVGAGGAYMIWGEARVKLKLGSTFAPGRQAHFVSTG